MAGQLRQKHVWWDQRFYHWQQEKNWIAAHAHSVQQLQSRVRSTIYLEHDWFFRGRLLIQDNEQVVNTVEKMEKEAKQIKDEMFRICWSMRGGITLDQAMQLSYQDRESIAELIKNNLETTKKSGLPYF